LATATPNAATTIAAPINARIVVCMRGSPKSLAG
jgi:hypothetical protein